MIEVNLNRHLYIAGPPFSGKTTSGSILAEELEVPFYDLDDIIEARGISIPEIFADQGEQGFRDIETASLREMTTSKGKFILALGGGTLLNSDNLQLCMDTGVIITLHADITDILIHYRRADRIRPLAIDENALRVLLEERQEHYSTLPNRIQTSGLSPRDITEAVKILIPELFT